jgi:PAS domain S-box-containing protein
MKFNTAFGFVLLGSLLLITEFKIAKYCYVISGFLSALIIGIGSISLLQTIFNFNTGFDQLFINDITSLNKHLPYPGRMAVNTAGCFILLGLAMLGFRSHFRIAHIISQYFLNLVTAISAIALIGYLYGLPLFYKVSYAGSMAVHTAVLFFFISITTSLQYPETGITKLFTGERVGNIMARRLFFMAIFIVVVFGALRVESQEFRVFSFTEGIAVLVISFLCIGLAIVWHMVNWLNGVDQSRHKAEKEVTLINEELEKRVKERSVKLMNLLAKFRESESKFKIAFEHSAIGMALVSLKGRWLQVNKRLCDMVGYKEHELLSMSFLDITHPDDSLLYRDLAAKILKNENYIGRIEKRYICKDGSIVWISVNIATVTNKKGGPVYFVSQFEDVTERKKAEASLKTAYKEIKKHVKNIQDMAWKQSHLIRSPLANLKGLTDLLNNDPANSQILQYIQAELERMDTVIIGMAEEVSVRGVKQIVVKKRSFKKVD